MDPWPSCSRQEWRGHLVHDVVDDPIVANADPVHASVGEFLHPGRARVAPKGSDFVDYPPPDRGFHLADLPLGGGRNFDAVGQPETSLAQFGAQLGEGFGALPGGLFAGHRGIGDVALIFNGLEE